MNSSAKIGLILAAGLTLAIPAIANAQVTRYTKADVGASIFGFRVDDYGRAIVSTFNTPAGARINTNGTWTSSPLLVDGLSSDGRVFGTIAESASSYKAASWDFSGEIKLFEPASDSWGFGGGNNIRQMTGEYAVVDAGGGVNAPERFGSLGTRLEFYKGSEILWSIDTTGGANTLYNGTLTENGTLIYLHSNELGEFESTVRKVDGSTVSLSNSLGNGIIQAQHGGTNIYAELIDANDLGLALTSWRNFTTNESGYSLYDSSTGIIKDLDNSFPGFSIQKVNNRGDMLATKLARKDGLDNYLDVWFFENGNGWVNVSETTGLGSLLSNKYSAFSLDMTNDGSIFGTLAAPHPYTNYDANTAFRTNPVPEPGTMLLLAAGAGGLITARRRRKQSRV